MNRYNATVHREGEWWVIDVDGVGVTQAKRLDKVEHMARDLVAAVLDADYDGVEVDVTFDLKPELDRALAAARKATEAARAAQKKASELSREAVTRLQGERWSIRDIARLTGISFQRVHQLLNEAVDTRRTTNPARSAQVDLHYPSADLDIVVNVGRESDERARV